MANQQRKSNETIEELLREVQGELDRRRQLRPSRIPALEQELATVESQKLGWVQSLGNPNLPAAARSAIEESLADAVAREHAIRSELDYEQAMQEGSALRATKEDVVAALDRLDRLLAGDNATVANVELAMHIDSIQCFADGKVRIRTSRLGALHGAAQLLKEEETSVLPENRDPMNDGTKRPRIRRLTRRDVRSAQPNDSAMFDLAESATDPKRFDGLSDQWFWIDEFQVPEKIGWTEEHAQKVLEHKMQHKSSTTELMAVFAKSRPTILKALRIAEQQRVDRDDGETAGRPRTERPADRVLSP